MKWEISFKAFVDRFISEKIPLMEWAICVDKLVEVTAQLGHAGGGHLLRSAGARCALGTGPAVAHAGGPLGAPVVGHLDGAVQRLAKICSAKDRRALSKLSLRMLSAGGPSRGRGASGGTTRRH